MLSFYKAPSTATGVLRPRSQGTQAGTSWSLMKISQVLSCTKGLNVGVGRSQGNARVLFRSPKKTLKGRSLVSAERCRTRKPRLSGAAERLEDRLAPGVGVSRQCSPLAAVCAIGGWPQPGQRTRRAHRMVEWLLPTPLASPRAHPAYRET